MADTTTLRIDSKLKENWDIELLPDPKCTLCLNTEAAEDTMLPLLSGTPFRDIVGWLETHHKGFHITEGALVPHLRHHIKRTPKGLGPKEAVGIAAKSIKDRAQADLEPDAIINSTINQLVTEAEMMAGGNQCRTSEYIALVQESRRWLTMRIGMPEQKITLSASEVVKKILAETSDEQ